MWRCDWKEWKLTVDDEWMVTYLDYYSRYVAGSEMLRDPTGAHTIELVNYQPLKRLASLG